MLGTEAAPFAFVSSLTEGQTSLRLDLFELGQELGRYVWVCEHPHCRPDLSGQFPLTIADTLIARVRTARHLIVLLGGHRHGTAIQVGDRASAVSHFEIELFQAALLGKPITVFVAEGFSPGPRLRAVLDLISWALPSTHWRGPLSAKAILIEVRQLLKIGIPLAPTRAKHSVRRHLVGRFYQSRGRQNSAQLRWLDDQREIRATEADLPLVDQLLTQAANTANQEHRLGRLWLALRELMAQPVNETASTEILTRWNEALGAWGSAAAWYGLHAHIYLGGRAALGSIVPIRALLRERQPSHLDSKLLFHPATALASATYSIAKLAPWVEQRQLLNEALRHLEHTPETLSIRSNQHAVRGSILLRQWHPWRAVSEYQAALKCRKSLGDPPARIGESLSELGFALIFTGQWRLARENLITGANLLEQYGSPGFACRALKKLAWFQKCRGQFSQAEDTQKRATKLAQDHALFDQL